MKIKDYLQLIALAFLFIATSIFYFGIDRVVSVIKSESVGAYLLVFIAIGFVSKVIAILVDKLTD